MVIIDLVTIIQFFKAIYTDIFKYIFAARTSKGGLLGPISSYFTIAKTND